MNQYNHLFSNGDLDETLRHQFAQIRKAVAQWSEDRLLSTPDEDIISSLRPQFTVAVPVLQHDEITTEPVEQGYAIARQFGEEVRVQQTIVTFCVPFKGDREIFTLRPNTWSPKLPTAIVGSSELKIVWAGQGHDVAAAKLELQNRLAEIEKWLAWSSAQITPHNAQAATAVANEVRSRKATLLANRDMEAAIGFPVRKRSDASTYAIPVTRKRVDVSPRPAAPVTGPFRPEPVLADAHYEEAIKILQSSRNQLERSPTTIAHMGEEAIRDNLLLNLNGQLEGKAGGEVFNGKGKTDILVRVEDRHVFIGECKFWKGPKTITSTLDQLLGYLVWRDTKAALLLFIRTGNPSEIIPKALDKFREHPNFKREGTHAAEFGERYNFIFHANGDSNREIKLAFLPFALLTPATS